MPRPTEPVWDRSTTLLFTSKNLANSEATALPEQVEKHALDRFSMAFEDP